MPKTFMARGTDGLVSIHEKGANYSDPFNNLDKIYFHSNLDYLRVAAIYYASFFLDEDKDDGEVRVVATHNLGYRPLLIVKNLNSNRTVYGADPVINEHKGFSMFSFCSDETKIYCKHTRLRYDYSSNNGDIGSYTANIKVFALENASINW